MNHAQYDQETGKPLDQSYLECGLPDDLQAFYSGDLQKSWAIIESGSRKDPHWDIYWCNLNADINSAEVELDYFFRAGMVFARKVSSNGRSDTS